jgi:GrpB-like predicted nucleotidyltransferase (UPF0157 family)
MGEADPDIVICAYRENWPDEFERIAKALRQILGAGPLRIDHIGSTGVFGLAAKDVIDVQITVATLSDKTDVLALKAAGYQLGEKAGDFLTGMDPDSPELKKFFLREIVGTRHVNIHVREVGRMNQRYALVFRDYLRHEPRVRAAYEVTKKNLAAEFGDDMDKYYLFKDPFMDAIYAGREIWATNTGWIQDDQFN